MIHAVPSLTDPPPGSPIAESLSWIQDATLGAVATTIAVIAVAAIGFLMLSGRLDLRRAVTVAVGCFLLFGAGRIAVGLTGLAGAAPPPMAVPDTTSLPQGQLSPPPTVYDPYAGASVPTVR
ncbi:TrbC/VirB2 family protein [Sphingopyxis granuli]|uniref:Type IV secretory pathway, VirB2 component (Pilin) n=1 Tax=Sphingopyxis granuli TaxID=267128 RepID=A0AA86L0W4_9SPHN|nr:TrbC/VirB2 family protein [Sphingopyxis granuli]AMG72879.1 Type IV secretory pathway, VirB2 component (Pilin) [Sphingopyxis granuli]